MFTFQNKETRKYINCLVSKVNPYVRYNSKELTTLTGRLVNWLNYSGYTVLVITWRKWQITYKNAYACTFALQMHIYVHTYVYAHVLTYVCVHAHKCTCTYIRIRVCTRIWPIAMQLACEHARRHVRHMRTCATDWSCTRWTQIGETILKGYQ